MGGRVASERSVAPVRSRAAPAPLARACIGPLHAHCARSSTGDRLRDQSDGSHAAQYAHGLRPAAAVPAAAYLATAAPALRSALRQRRQQPSAALPLARAPCKPPERTQLYLSEQPPPSPPLLQQRPPSAASPMLQQPSSRSGRARKALRCRTRRARRRMQSYSRNWPRCL